MSVLDPIDVNMKAHEPPQTNSSVSLEALYRAHWNEICAFIARTFGAGPPEPEDAAQAAFTQFAALTDASLIRNPRAFLYQSARNFVLDAKRRINTQNRLGAEAGDNLHEHPAQSDSQRVLEGKERLAAILATVRTLESRRRKVLIWHALHDLTFTEIASRLGISKARVRQLFAEALAACEKAAREMDQAGGAP